MRTAIYPGSFDPITNGHLNIIRRASKMFDRLIVCVLVNPSKEPLFSTDERLEMIRSVVSDIPNVTVGASDGLLTDYAAENGASVIVKGIRNGADLDHELLMASFNKKLNPDLDTMFLPAEQEYMYLSSSAVKELGIYNASLTGFLPEKIIPKFKQRVADIRQGGERK